jgi:F-type H+-transporting ATPase subunit b
MFIASVLASSYPVWWLAQLIAIAILVFLFLRWRPGFLSGKTIGETLGALLQTRKEQIEEQLAAAERSRQEAERLREQTQADLIKAREEADRIVSGAEQTSEAIRNEIVQRASEEAARVSSQASAEIEQEKSRAILALQRRAADIVVDAAGQVISRNLDQDTDRSLIDRSLREMRETR